MATVNKIKISLRCDELSNWTEKNPVLNNGELAIVNDAGNQQFKIGNGLSTFNQLPFFNENEVKTTTLSAQDVVAKSVSQGLKAKATPLGFAAGAFLSANANFSQAFGYNAETKADDIYAFVWNGDDERALLDYYQSHGKGTFSINPISGMQGVFIGENSLCAILSYYAKISVDNEAVQDFKMLHISYDEHAQLVNDENIDPHTIYVLSADGYDDQFGNRIINLGSPISADDAATKNYVDSEIAKIPQPEWGRIEGNIEDQADLVGKLNEKASKSNVDAIEEKIPAAADASNQLADKAFVNSSINNYAAFYLTKNAKGDAFGTYAELTSATKFWNAGVEKTPTKNDYLVVLQDETKTTALGVNPTTRYIYQGEWPTGQFEFQYIVNNIALTQAQVDAINSGITKSIVDSRVIPSSTKSGYAANAVNADTATTANTALSATYAPDYTPLSTFNETLGNLASIIHEI